MHQRSLNDVSQGFHLKVTKHRLDAVTRYGTMVVIVKALVRSTRAVSPRTPGAKHEEIFEKSAFTLEEISKK